MLNATGAVLLMGSVGLPGAYEDDEIQSEKGPLGDSIDFDV